MRLRLRHILSSLLLFAGTTTVGAQMLDLEAYKRFLNENQTMSAAQVMESHPAGVFSEKVAALQSSVRFLDSIDQKYELTTYEHSLLGKHGFMVSERLTAPTFVQAYADIYHKDLPVFISSDGVLHALHMSYSNILATTEREYLRHKLADLLAGLRAQLPGLAEKYSRPEIRLMLSDLDVYLTVPLRLLGSPTSPVFSESGKTVDELMEMIEQEQPQQYPLFSSSARMYDFSQFTPRGHYAADEDLSKYFQAMMWLGRTELYLTSPQDAVSSQKIEDIQRQTIVSALLLEAAGNAGSFAIVDEMESVLAFLVGEQDNVTIHNMRDLFSSMGITRADDLLDMARLEEFQETLLAQSYAFQRITSQILYNNPFDLEATRPASALMLLGQRFILDSYITCNVVYDRIKARRMLPSTLDVLFALGNNASAQLLQPELDRYNYGGNLSALRYLVDSYDNGFWNGTFYNLWLNSIRSLNPPEQRDHMPKFMQTAAWWQQKMNTQLASWAQLRHDNLLYAKQSYSAGVTCSFPHSYVEPIPAFFAAVGTLAREAHTRFSNIEMGWASQRVPAYFKRMEELMEVLEKIAQKELDGTALSKEDEDFLSRMLFINPGCGDPEYNGWYSELYFEGLKKEDRVIADIHTAPTDADGNQVGWVMHVGTGPINMGVWTVKMPDGQSTAFVGPVMSYYEHVSAGFKRLTDEEWQDSYQASAGMRPDFVNIYLADKNGESRGKGAMLLTGETTDIEEGTQDMPRLNATGFPNPFDGFTTIRFTIPAEAAYQPVSLVIYTAQGREVRRLFHTPVPTGTYMVRWNGDDAEGRPVTAGSYVYRLSVGGYEATGTLVLTR